MSSVKPPAPSSDKPAPSSSTDPNPPVLHKMHYPGLTLGHPEVSVTDLHIVGLELKVYGLEEIRGSGLPVAAMIAAHGRMNNQKNMKYFAQGILGEVAAKPQAEKKRDLIVVTFDQRNHGERIKDRQANLAFDENPRHFVDMAATVAGGCHDVTLIIDFLEAYLFPHGEKIIEEFVLTGISLGGNVTWRLAREEPRIKTLIPIIGLPFEAFPVYLRARASSLSPPLPWEAPTYPPGLRPFFQGGKDGEGLEGYEGKKILSLHGGADALVPIAQGRADLERIKSFVEGKGKGEVVVDVQENVGHACTVEMLRKAAEWTWRWTLA
ncbi:hypothetical protein IAT38_003303 [Cryptococcus sp. DSM 104549]